MEGTEAAYHIYKIQRVTNDKLDCGAIQQIDFDRDKKEVLS